MARRCQVRLKEAEERGADLEARAGIAARRVPTHTVHNYETCYLMQALSMMLLTRLHFSIRWHAPPHIRSCRLSRAGVARLAYQCTLPYIARLL